MALRMNPVEMADLVPESRDWHSDVYHWITSVGTHSAMIGYAELFWPDMVEHDGCVFRGEIDEANYRDWMERLEGDRSAVEKMCNHIDMNYLLAGNYEDKATDAQLTYLGRLLQQMWQAKLVKEFPGRQFAVEYSENLSDPDDEPLLTFSQIRTA